MATDDKASRQQLPLARRAYGQHLCGCTFPVFRNSCASEIALLPADQVVWILRHENNARNKTPWCYYVMVIDGGCRSCPMLMLMSIPIGGDDCMLAWNYVRFIGCFLFRCCVPVEVFLIYRSGDDCRMHIIGFCPMNKRKVRAWNRDR